MLRNGEMHTSANFEKVKETHFLKQIIFLKSINSLFYLLVAHCVHSSMSVCKINDPAHEIMVLSVIRKLIFQIRMRSHPMGLDV